MLPVQPTGPAISLELDVDDGEVENYEVRLYFLSLFSCLCVCQIQTLILKLLLMVLFPLTGPPEPR